jgi:hypothetical protein
MRVVVVYLNILIIPARVTASEIRQACSFGKEFGNTHMQCFKYKLWSYVISEQMFRTV